MKFLVSGPEYFGYTLSAANALRRLGHDADLVTYDLWGGTAHKAASRIGDVFNCDVRQIRLQMHQRRLVERVRQTQYDAVLLLNSDMITNEVYDIAAGRVIVWLIDDMDRFGFEIAILERASLVASYCKSDAKRLISAGIPAVYLPMGFDDAIKQQERVICHNPVLVGAKYPAREAAIWAAQRAGSRIDTFGFGWSPYWRDRIREFDFGHRPPHGHPSVSRSQAYALYQSAPAAINIHSSSSAGLNPRTFEICGSGGLQIVDRLDVDELLEPGRELLVAMHSPDELLEILTEVLTNPNDQKWTQIRQRGREVTLAKHTFVERFRVMLELLP